MKEEFAVLSSEIRKMIIESAMKAGGGHIASSFSIVEILISLYWDVMLVDPKNPKWEDRDRLILSKGHGSLALYSVLAKKGFFPESEVYTFCQPGSCFGGHIDSRVTGVDVSTGSLGQGLAMGIGIALAAKLNKKNYRVFVLLGDGECQEGSTWEAVMLAGHLKLKNLVAIIDHNKLQLSDFTDKITSSLNEKLANQWEAFDWNTLKRDGHNIREISEAFESIANEKSEKPSLLIAETVKGKGASIMEGSPLWHYRTPSAEEAKNIFDELEAKLY